MKKKLFLVLALFSVVLNLGGYAPAQKTVSETSGYQLAKLLPESDAVILLDSKRLIVETLPQVLSANQVLLSKIIGKIDTLKDETGLDLRDFQDVAIGLKSKTVSEAEIDFDPIVLARGSVDSKALIAVARLASDGKYQTEIVGDHTIYIFSTDKLIENNKPEDDPKNSKSFIEKTIDKMFKGVSDELAITAYNENTVAIGSVARVKETITRSSRISENVLGLLNQKPNAVGIFGALLPTGLSRYIDLDNDELGATLDAVRMIKGAMDVRDGNVSLLVMAETLDVKQAQDLEGTLTGLQMLGKILLGSSKSPDKQVYARMIENAKISRTEKLIKFELAVPKSDIDVIVGKK